jgi:hypothetical protein
VARLAFGLDAYAQRRWRADVGHRGSDGVPERLGVVL